MNKPAVFRLLMIAGVLSLAGCERAADETDTTDAAPTTSTTAESDAGAATAGAGDAQAAAPIEHFLLPLPGMGDTVPEITRKQTVRLDTTEGEVLIEVYPEAAPNAAARFVELVENGFYDNTPVSRVIPGFVAQFGINWREDYSAWQDRNFVDDPSLFALDRGTLAFAKAGPDTNSTQVFINYANNNHLAAPQYNFTTFGRVVSGMEVVDSFRPVGDPNGGLDQGRLWSDGEAYLNELTEQPSFIEDAEVVE